MKIVSIVLIVALILLVDCTQSAEVNEYINIHIFMNKCTYSMYAMTSPLFCCSSDRASLVGLPRNPWTRGSSSLRLRLLAMLLQL